MVGGEHHTVVAGRKGTEEVGNGRMAKPAEGDAAVGCLSGSQFAHHAAFGAGMGEHVDKVEHHHIEVVLAEGRKLLE